MNASENEVEVKKQTQILIKHVLHIAFVLFAIVAFGQTSAAGTSSALFKTDGTLTELGQFYADFKPNLKIELKN